MNPARRQLGISLFPKNIVKAFLNPDTLYNMPAGAFDPTHESERKREREGERDKERERERERQKEKLGITNPRENSRFNNACENLRLNNACGNVNFNNARENLRLKMHVKAWD